MQFVEADGTTWTRIAESLEGDVQVVHVPSAQVVDGLEAVERTQG